MRNFLLAYFVTRALVGERVARTGVLIAFVGMTLVVVTFAVSMSDFLAPSFLIGVQNGRRKWQCVEQTRQPDTLRQRMERGRHQREAMPSIPNAGSDCAQVPAQRSGPTEFVDADPALIPLVSDRAGGLLKGVLSESASSVSASRSYGHARRQSDLAQGTRRRL